MGRNFVGAERDQLFLLPPDARQWLPERHLAWAVLEQAGQMDLGPFLSWYRADGQGRPAYHPRLMVTLIMYCYCKGIRSSRAVEMATFDDVGARVICGNLHPDHATIARFVTRHEQPVKGLLVASLTACAREGLVSVEVVAGDGTKVKASASMAANAAAERLEIEIGELEALLAAEVDGWLAQARAADAAEDALFGGGDGPGAGGGPGTLARLTDKIVRRRKARARLEAGEQARQQDAGADREATITAARDRVTRAEQRAAREEAAAAAKVAGYQARAAAKAAAGGRKGPDGRVPVAPGDSAHVRQARQAAAHARRKLAEAVAAPAAAAAPDPPPKANTTDPASRVMPARKAASASCTTSRSSPAGIRSSRPSPPTTTPPTPGRCTRCWTWPGLTCAPPASPARSARPCSTPGTPARTTSPLPASRTYTSRSPKRPARPGGCATARQHHPASPAGRP